MCVLGYHNCTLCWLRLVGVTMEADLRPIWQAWANCNKKEARTILPEHLRDNVWNLGLPEWIATGELTTMLMLLSFDLITLNWGSSHLWSATRTNKPSLNSNHNDSKVDFKCTTLGFNFQNCNILSTENGDVGRQMPIGMSSQEESSRSMSQHGTP
jgi:hypothetical protein